MRAVAPAGTNLLANGDAETGATSYRGYDEVIVPGWRVVEGLPTVVRYGAKGGLPADDLPRSGQPWQGILRRWVGGTPCLEQDVPLAAPGGGPLARGTKVTVDGWLGGLAASKDNPSVTLTFRGPGGGTLRPPPSVPSPTTPGKNTTELLTCPVRWRSRRARRRAVSLVMTTPATNYDGWNGSTTGNNQAWADDLSLTASAPVRAPTPLTPPTTKVPVVRPRLRRHDGEPGLRRHHRQHQAGAVPQQPAAEGHVARRPCTPRCTRATPTTWRCRPARRTA